MSSWPQVPLSEVLRPIARAVEPQPGTAYRQIGVRLWGEGAYERESIDGLATKYAQLFQAREGDVIVNKIWARNGSVAVVQSELDGCHGSGEFPMFEPDRSLVDPRWIHWLTKTKSFWLACDEKSQGSSGKNRIRPERFLEIEIPLPPLPEQRRVVARIEEVAGLVGEARRLRRVASEETAAVYSTLLALAMSPKSPRWREGVVAGITLSMDAGWSPQCEGYPPRDEQWGVLKTTSVQWCKFDPSEAKALPASLRPKPELALKEGDVLVTRAGPRKRVGVVAAVRWDEPKLTISDKLIRLRPDPEKVEPRFLELALAAPLSQEHLVQRKTGLADAQVNISQAILAATPIAYPSLPEQRRIVASLDRCEAQVNELERPQTESSTALDALIPAVLDRAFRGEL